MRCLVLSVLFALFIPFNAEAGHCRGPHAGDPGCDDSGSNSGIYQFEGFTSASNMVVGAVRFSGMHAACQAEFGALARFCTSKEFLLSLEQGTPDEPAWVHPVLDFTNNQDLFNSSWQLPYQAQ